MSINLKKKILNGKNLRCDWVCWVFNIPNSKVNNFRECIGLEALKSRGDEVVFYNEQGSRIKQNQSFFFVVPVIDPLVLNRKQTSKDETKQIRKWSFFFQNERSAVFSNKLRYEKRNKINVVCVSSLTEILQLFLSASENTWQHLVKSLT